MFKRGEFDYSHEAKKLHSDALRTADRLNRLGHNVTHEDVRREQHEKACERAKVLLQEMLDSINNKERIERWEAFKHFVKKYNIKIGKELADKIRKEAHRLREVKNGSR